MKTKNYPNGHKFSEKDYDNIEELLNYKIPASKIKKMTGWSQTTIARCQASSDYSDYLKQMDVRLKEIKEKNKAKTASLLPTPQVEVSDKVKYQNQWIEAIKENTKEVKLLREAIYVVRSEKKKGWF